MQLQCNASNAKCNISCIWSELVCHGSFRSFMIVWYVYSTALCTMTMRSSHCKVPKSFFEVILLCRRIACRPRHLRIYCPWCNCSDLWQVTSPSRSMPKIQSLLSTFWVPECCQADASLLFVIAAGDFPPRELPVIPCSLQISCCHDATLNNKVDTEIKNLIKIRWRRWIGSYLICWPQNLQKRLVNTIGSIPGESHLFPKHKSSMVRFPVFAKA